MEIAVSDTSLPNGLISSSSHRIAECRSAKKERTAITNMVAQEAEMSLELPDQKNFSFSLSHVEKLKFDKKF